MQIVWRSRVGDLNYSVPPRATDHESAFYRMIPPFLRSLPVDNYTAIRTSTRSLAHELAHGAQAGPAERGVHGLRARRSAAPHPRHMPMRVHGSGGTPGLAARIALLNEASSRRLSDGSPLSRRSSMPSPSGVPEYFGAGLPSMIRRSAVQDRCGTRNRFGTARSRRSASIALAREDRSASRYATCSTQSVTSAKSQPSDTNSRTISERAATTLWSRILGPSSSVASVTAKAG